jgi:hypothetical protein
VNHAVGITACRAVTFNLHLRFQKREAHAFQARASFTATPALSAAYGYSPSGVYTVISRNIPCDNCHRISSSAAGTATTCRSCCTTDTTSA